MLNEAFAQARALLVPAPRTSPEACDRCVPDFYGEPVDVAPPFRGPCAHVRAARISSAF